MTFQPFQEGAGLHGEADDRNTGMGKEDTVYIKQCVGNTAECHRYLYKVQAESQHRRASQKEQLRQTIAKVGPLE